MSLRGRVTPDGASASGPAETGALSGEPGSLGHGPKDTYYPGEVDTPRGAGDLDTLVSATPRADDAEHAPQPGAETMVASRLESAGLERSDSARFPPTARGTYAIAGKFAQGGIGRILRAHDPVLDRTVALKELLVAGHRTDEERFVREVLLTARLQHPGIVPVYAAGRWPSGEPFYAMKLVSGRSFDQVLAEASTLPARLALLPHVLAIAETVAYAHAQGIIHRDLKPQNVLVGEFGETVVIDWGLAKQLGEPEDPVDADPRLANAAVPVDPTQQLTHVGAIVGTPGFMSPEQASSAAAVDERSDVYALGVILYQALSGALPYDAESAVEMVFKTVYDRPVPLQRREPQVPEELTAIVEKAMARELAARYPTARAFADDLRRFQTGQIVGAHRYTAWELLLRALRRYRAPIAAAAVALVIIIIITALSFSRVAAERDRAIDAEADALAAESAAQDARRQAEERADILAIQQAHLRADNEPMAALDLLHQVSPTADWRRVRQIAAAVQQRGIPIVLHGHQASVSRAVFSPDNRRLATTSDDCTLRVWDLSHKTSRAYYGHTDEVWRAAWSPDMRQIATTSRDHTVRVWDLDTGVAQVLVGHQSGIRNVTFGPGRSLYSGDDAQVLRRWNLDTGTSEIIDDCLGSSFPWDERQIACLSDARNELIVHDLRSGARTVLRVDGVKLGPNGSLSPDGRWAVAGTVDIGDADAILWDRESGTPRRLDLTQPVDLAGRRSRELRFSPSSDRLLVPLADQYLATYDLRSDTTELRRPHTGYTRRATFSPDGGLVASVGGDVGVHLWDESSASGRSLTGALALMIDVQFSRDGRHLAAVGNDPRVLLWTDAVFRPQVFRMAGNGPVRFADAAAAEATALVRDRQLVILDTATLRPRLEINTPEPLSAVSLSPDARLVTGLDGTPALRVWDAVDGRLLHTRRLDVSREGCGLVTAPDGHRVALDCLDGKVFIADIRSGELVKVDDRGPYNLAFLNGRGELVIGGPSGRVDLWEPGAAPRLIHEYPYAVHHIAPVPTGRKVVFSYDRVVDVWDAERDTLTPLAGHTLQVSAVGISADGSRLVTSGRDNVVRIFALETGALLHTITPSALMANLLALSADGEVLAGSAHDGQILLWDLLGGPETLREPRLLLGHSSKVGVMRFAADARSLLSIDNEGRAIRWADGLPRDPAGLRAWLDAHHDPRATAPPTRSGCLASPLDAAP
jgi:WD40 repeat protein